MEKIVSATSDIRGGGVLTLREIQAEERRSLVRRFTAQGLSAREIAVRLDCADRTVVRHRAALRAEVAA